ncbi:MAG: hypothetical protein GX801_11940 [Fibrobacter sp.]|nr:hypothetical protein [Fibrobacter sp.]
MIRTDGYYVSEAFPWVDWHAGHKFEGINYEYLFFLNDKEFIRYSSEKSSINTDNLVFLAERKKNLYYLVDNKTIELVINPQSSYSKRRYFTILSPFILLDEDLKEYKFIPFDK